MRRLILHFLYLNFLGTKLLAWDHVVAENKY